MIVWPASDFITAIVSARRSASWSCPGLRDLCRVRIDHIAERIYHDKRAENQPAAQVQAGRAQTRFHGLTDTIDFADRGATASAHIAFSDRAIAGSFTRRIAHRRIRADIHPSQTQVVQNSGRDDRHSGRSCLKADAPLLQPPDHATGRIQSERAPTGKHNRVHLLNKAHRIQPIGLARAGRAATLIHPGDCPCGAQDDRHTRQRLVVLRMPHSNVGDIGDSIMHATRPSSPNIPRAQDSIYSCPSSSTSATCE